MTAAMPGQPRQPLESLQPLQLWAKWMRGVASATDKTIQTRLNGVHALCNHAGNGIPADPLSLTKMQIVVWLADCDKAWTRRTYAVTARQWHQWLVDQGLRPDDPTADLPLPPMPKGAPRPAATSVLNEVLDQAPRKVRAYISLAAYAGLRTYEIAPVRGEDFVQDADGEWLYVLGKGDKPAAIPVHPVLSRMRRGFPETGFWFPGRTDAGHVRASSVSATISREFHRCGHPVTAQQLRHWFGTHTLRVTRDLRVTQELMRHESIQSTQIYTLVSGSAKVEAVRRLAGVVT